MHRQHLILLTAEYRLTAVIVNTADFEELEVLKSFVKL